MFLRQFFLTCLLTCSIHFLTAQSRTPVDIRLDPRQETSHYCATDHFFDHRASQAPGVQRAQNDQDDLAYQALSTGAIPRSGSILTIPTVVHIIHNNGPENISNPQINNAIAEINQAMRNLGYYDPSTGVDTEIELCLVVQDTTGQPTNGIIRVVDPLTNMTLETQDGALKNLSRWNTSQFLNIWVVNSINSQFLGPGVAGYSTLPASHGQPNDGFVVEYNFFGAGSQDGNKVSVHELGHYLGLYHTFEGSCVNNNCLTDGDRVCDTPPDASIAGVPCTATPNTCTTDADDTSTNNPFRPVTLGGLGDQNDLFQDYMDYSALSCVNVFTQGQKDRMRMFLQTTRASLLQNNACTLPCSNPVSAFLSPSANTVFLGGTVNFTNSSTGATSYTWKDNGQVFSNSLNSSQTFTTTGIHLITLVAENASPGCIDSTTVTIEVLCQAQASFNPPAGTIQPGQSALFINTSTGNSSSTWYLGGAFAGTSSNLNYTFTQPGIYQIKLVVSNGVCQDSVILPFRVGLCLDQRYDQWRFGDYCGIDFSSGTPVSAPSPSMKAFESTAALADANGNLLFYTNGGGSSSIPTHPGGIWNRNDSLMPNGNLSPNDLGCTSAFQAANILENPGNPHQFYVFVNSCGEDMYLPGFGYHLVDMTLDNGLGDVLQKNVVIDTTGSETMGVVRHCNGEDYWIGTLDRNLNQYKFYLLTANGITTPPVLGSFIPNTEFPRFLKFSPDGRTMVVNTFYQSHKLFLYDFDPATAILTFRETINLNTSFFGGVDFSSDSRYLFTFTKPPASNGAILQYDLDSTLVAPTMTQTLLPFLSTGLPAGVQLGPDGRIYFNFSFESQIYSITDPTQPMAATNLDTVFLDPNCQTLIGLPNAPATVYGDPFPIIGGSSLVCTGNTLDYQLDFDPCQTQAILWEYRGAGQLGATTDSTASVMFGTPGIDTLIATKVGACSEISDTLFITVGTGTPPSLPDSVPSCGPPIVLDPGPGYVSYLWSTSDTTQSITVSATGWYWVDLVHSLGCTYRDSVEILPFPAPPQPQLGPDTTLCGAVMVLTPGSGFNSYLWQDNSTTATYTAYQAGTYIVEVTGPCGQSATDTLVVFPCVGLTDPVPGLEIEVYPNPNQGSFTLKINHPQDWGGYQIEVFDGLGKRIYARRSEGFRTEIREEIDLGEVPSGIYQLQLSGPTFIHGETIWIR